MFKKILETFFWLGLSLLFGGIIILGAVAAPAVFDTTRDAHITVPGISPPLDPTRQAGGEIFGVILQRFAYVEAGALLAILIALVGWFATQRPIRKITFMLGILWLLIASIVAYNDFSLTPQVWSIRQQVRDTAPQHVTDSKDSPPETWPQRAQFDRLHILSENLGKAEASALLAMLILAACRCHKSNSPISPAK